MEKIKHFIKSDTGKDLWIVLIVISVGIISFGLGRLSVQSNGLDIKYQDLGSTALLGSEKARVFLENNPKLNKANQTPEKAYFASKRGQKYYSFDCSAGKNIKVENRIYFSTTTEAEKAGYEMSTSCR